MATIKNEISKIRKRAGLNFAGMRSKIYCRAFSPVISRKRREDGKQKKENK
jgi:hypothetical protein